MRNVKLILMFRKKLTLHNVETSYLFRPSVKLNLIAYYEIELEFSVEFVQYKFQFSIHKLPTIFYILILETQ